MKPLNIFVLGASALLISATVSLGDIKIVADYNDNDHTTPAFKFKNTPSPSKDDAATKAKFSIVDGERDPAGGDLTILNDGKLPTEEDQPPANFFFAENTDGGRLLVDLGGVMGIKQVNTYSWHPNTRGPQVYKLYASDGTAEGFKTAPKKGTDPLTCGWKLIAKIDTRPKSDVGGGQHGVSISDSDGNIGKYRYLLFDCSETEGTDDSGNTFFSEIDVIRDGGAAVADASDEPYVTHSVDGKCEITIDTSAAPDLKEWARTKLAPVLNEWYPKIVAELPMENYTPPPRFSVMIGAYGGVAATDTGRSRVTANATWFRGQLDREAVGALVHEEVHVIQLYRPNSGNAGGGGRGGAGADTQLTALETALGSTNKLSDAQKTKVKATLDDQTKKMADLRADTSIQRADRTAKTQAIRDETTKTIKDVLNAQQYKAWEQMAQGGRGGSGGLPGWLVEAIPDYIRWFIYEPQSHGADDTYLKRQATRNLPKSFADVRYDAPYRPGANFLNWVAETYDKNIVAKVNAVARQGKYSEEIWKTNCKGKTSSELGAEWKAQLAKKFGVDWPPASSNSNTNSSGG